MINRVVFPIALQRLIAPESIREIDAAFARSGFEMRHQRVGRDVLPHLRVDLAIAFS